MSLAVRISLALLLACGAGAAVGYALGARARPEPVTLDLGIRDGGVYVVRKVVDGDTVVLENGLHVRYQGVDTPEVGHFVKDVAPLAAEATARNIELVEGKRVRLRLGSPALDVHGRIVARLFVAGEGRVPELDVTKVLLQEGLGRAMGLDTSPDDFAELKRFQSDAQAAKAGLWGVEDRVRADHAGKPYCAADKSRIYHLRTCPLAARIAPANLHVYASTDEAEAAGRSPCRLCVPKE